MSAVVGVGRGCVACSQNSEGWWAGGGAARTLLLDRILVVAHCCTTTGVFYVTRSTETNVLVPVVKIPDYQDYYRFLWILKRSRKLIFTIGIE